MSLIPDSIQQAAQHVPAPTPVVVPGLAGDDVLDASLALTTDQPVVIPGMVRPFLDHQAAAYVAAEASIERWGAVLLGDDMGLGKTAVMVALAAQRITPGHPALVIAPPVTRHGWQGELRAMFPNLRLAFLHGRTRKDVPDADVLFVNDDSLTMQAWLTDVTTERRGGKDVKVHTASAVTRQASIVLRDEIHRDKGNGSKPSTRSKVMLAIGEWARVAGVPVVGATGTLLTNRPVEGFIPLQILGGEDLVKAVTPGSHRISGYLFRYCGAQSNGYGTNFNGCDLDQVQNLHEYLRRTVYVRREKGDLGDKLPHSGWIVLPLSLQGSEYTRRYHRIEREFLDLMTEEHGPAAAWRMARAEAIVKMGKLREEAGAAKVDATVEYVLDLMTDDNGKRNDEQIVLFYEHTEVHDRLAKAFDKAGISTISINGKVTGDARADAIDAFQAGDAQVCIAQHKAAGMGVTLTAANHAVFVQVPWSAGDLKQCADRVYRVDDRTRQKALDGIAINWHVLQMADEQGRPSFDMAMWAVLERKAKVCDAVNAGQDVTMPEESVMKLAMEAWYNQAMETRTTLGL